MIRVMVSNLDRLVKDLSRGVSHAVEMGLLEAGQASAAALAETSLGVSASGTFAKSWVALPVSQKGHVFSVQVKNTAPYAYYVEHGRKAGKAPPLNEIAQWALTRGIISSDVSHESGDRAERDAAELGGETLSVGKRKLREKRVARAPMQRIWDGPGGYTARTDAQIVGAIVGNLKMKDTEGQHILHNAIMRARMLRFVRDKIRKHLKGITKAGVT